MNVNNPAVQAAASHRINLMTKKLKERLQLIAIAEDKATEEFFAVIRFRTVKGRFRTKEFPLAALDDAKELRRELINKGAYFAPDNEDPVSSIRALQMVKDRAHHWTYAKTLGWTGEKFVRAKGVVGKQNQGSLLKPPRVVHPAAKKMGKKGTLGGWQKRVAKPAAQSSRMVTAICAAFGAPLLKFTDIGSFALFFTGPSKVGKSTLTLAAGSVIGFATESSLPNFRSTSAALGELPGQFNDHVLPLNESRLARGTPKERRQTMREFAFGAAEGHGTTYSRLSPAANAGQDEYRSIIVANGEETSDELALQAGEYRLAGECSRWMDVPAAGRGSPDSFDLGPELHTEERAAWLESTCADIRKGCRLHHGVAGRHFVRSVVKHRKTVRAELVKLRDLFVNAVAEAEPDQVVLHMAKNFGHLYAAGVLAVQFKTVPWSEKQVMICIRRCFQAARQEIKTEAELLRRSLLKLKENAKARTMVQHQHHRGKSLKGVEGYRRNHGKDKTIVTIRAEALKRWFKDPRQPRLVLDYLRKHGRLACSGTPGHGQSIKWAESQRTWPDGQRVRSIVITFRPAL
jgi:putative DNA primase/helicase